MNQESKPTTKDLLSEMREQTKWLKFLALPALKKSAEESFSTKEQKRIYELSDGKNSTNDIAKRLMDEGLKVSHMTVYNYWKRWFAVGLVVPSKRSGRFEKIIELEDLNLSKS